uniref:photosystem I reaction center subunit III(plastocyanin-binding) n=1 Tax=Lophurella stichidiosa TaxID=2008659 RepID=UPI0025520756|nr:photosystem I reaction center subunit III(plastocyanin-binding) [Aphanocladia stichidiosa]WGH13974.1 photosystem I reaction center subunit III(plastocyanin-binding) [Aphanocladia stichidiosa]
MKKSLVILLSALIFIFNSQFVYAEVSGLVPCKDSPAFNKRLKQSIKKLEVRLSKYEPSTPPALALNNQIKQTQSRFDKYGKAGILCGTEGLPHLIADGRWNHAGDFMLPGLLFIYITGWIGWVGRGYLQAVSLSNKPSQKEIIIDVPLAMKFSLSGFTWPLAALQEFTSGQLLATDDDISISPR